jgi:predicted amidohydrolase YtcJ
MNMRALIVASAVTLAAVAGLMSACSQQQADMFIYGGTIYSLSANSPTPEAVLVTGETISFAGSKEEAERQAGPRTLRVDLNGGAMIPGLVDAHAHLRSLGRYLAQLKLETAASPAEVREMVLAAQRSTPEGRWIQGRGWDQNDWAVKQFPTWRDLEGTEANPVYFRRVDGHAGWVNRAALEMCGITRDTPDPDGGRIVRDDGGEPTGVLVDNAKKLVTDLIPDSAPEEIDDWMRAAIEHCNALGLVGMHDAGTDADDLASLRRLHQSGDLTLNVYCMLSTDEEDLAWTEEQLRGGPRTEAGGRVVVRAVKLYADGALGSRGAAMLEPYSDEAGNVGLLVTPIDELERLTRLAAQYGIQVCTHAIGDRGNRVILDTYEKVLGELPGDAGPRFRVEHAQILSEQDIPRFKQLGVIPSMQPTHCTSDMYWAEDRVGPDRIEGAYAWQRLIEDGNIIPCGSDFPVEGADPLAGIYAAVTRRDQKGWPEDGWHSDQRMAVEEAVKGFTQWAAYAAFDESGAGTIEPGKRADFTVIDRDLMKIEPVGILEAEVRMTVVRGQVVYEAD